MRSVYERLKPELVAQIEKESVKYPSTMESLVNRLKGEFFYTDIRYGDAMALESLYRDAFGKQCDFLFHCFSEEK